MKLVAESQDYVKGGTQKDCYTAAEVVEAPCPLCGGAEREPIYTEHDVIGVVRCHSCGLLYTSPRLRNPEKVYWGDAEAYYREARLIFEGKAAHHRDPNYLEELRLIERYKRPGRLLDIGCNIGMLLCHARRRGWDVVGVEPSSSLAQLAAKHGFPIHNCFVDGLPADEEQSFDAVTLGDVLEHVCEPVPFLKDVARFLKPDGVLYVKVPNALWNLFKQRMLGLLGKRPEQGLWDAYEHVVHYTDDSLRRMLGKGGFQVLRTTMGKPVQTPVWHELVGHYYQYPTPFLLDWKRQLVRGLAYRLAGLERLLRFGSMGYLAPNIIAVARLG
jgi:SAM-dependent methyltransferase